MPRVTYATARDDVQMQSEGSTRVEAIPDAPQTAAKGGVSNMTFSEWFEHARTNWRREEGQTMAEYGVVLAVITIGAVAVFTALSGGISDAINRVIDLLPGGS
jgi:Flp pilus assembly pilin Flp